MIYARKVEVDSPLRLATDALHQPHPAALHGAFRPRVARCSADFCTCAGYPRAPRRLCGRPGTRFRGGVSAEHPNAM
jgi:hypothetical protein